MEKQTSGGHVSPSDCELSPLKETAPQNTGQEDEMKRRVIYFNEPLPETAKFPSNQIRTSKYTVLTWAPKSLL